MKFLLASLLILACTTSALAGDLGNQSTFQKPFKSPKSHSHILQNPAFDREGGETIEDAVPILELPFADTGATCDNINDYDVQCPFYGSPSPDVVYSITPAVDQGISIDLCYSLFDTKVYVFDQDLQLMACNDDFYTGPPCGQFVSFIPEVLLNGGETYYIIIDGYGGDCGEYTLEVNELLICGVECPPEGVPEGEPDLQDGYVDTFNGGCNSDPAVFQSLPVRPDGCGDLCGISGWYLDGAISSRDTDWFEAIGTGEVMAITLEADLAIQLYVIRPDCDNLVSLAEGQAPSLEPVEVLLPTEAGQLYWIWVGPQEYTGWGNEFDYVLTVCGLEGTVSSDRISWDAVKTLYR
jgi:hypothetical protein